MRLFDDPFLLAVPAGDAAPRTRRGIDRATSTSDRLILLEEGHCLRDQALAFCAERRGGGTMGLGATSLATVMQMVANGYGVTLVPQIAVDVEVRDERVKLLALRAAAARPHHRSGLAAHLAAQGRFRRARAARDGSVRIAAACGRAALLDVGFARRARACPPGSSSRRGG